MNIEDKADIMEFSKELYRIANPESKMCVPNSVYITTEKWYKEWLNDRTTKMDLLDWCLLHKQTKTK